MRSDADKDAQKTSQINLGRVGVLFSLMLPFLAILGRLKGIWGHLGEVFGRLQPSSAVLAHLGPSWKASWSHLGLILGASWDPTWAS